MSDQEIQALATDPEIQALVAKDYLPYWQRDPGNPSSRAREIVELERMLENPVTKPKNPGQYLQRIKAQKHDLESQTPPPLTAGQRDKIQKLVELCKASFQEGMLTQEEYRRNPPGAVDAHTAWDRAKKPHVLLYKRGMQLLHPHSEAMDLTNIEKFRPATPTRNLHLDGQVPGVFALSAQAKAHYDEIDWPHPSESLDAMATRLKGAGYTVRKRRGSALRTPKETPRYTARMKALDKGESHA